MPSNLFRNPSWTASDARGRTVDLIDPVRFGPASSAAFQMSRADARDLKRESTPYPAWVCVLVLLVAAAIILWNVVEAISEIRTGEWFLFLWSLAYILFWCGAAAFMLRIGHLSEPPLFVAAMLRRRRCPACAYDLTGIPEDEFKVTSCPECAAAWWIDAPPPRPRIRTLRRAPQSANTPPPAPPHVP